MATVYLGWMESDGDFFRPVAVKVMHPVIDGDREVRHQMVYEEARVASRIRHANVVSVSDVVSSENGPVLVMDYVAGISLSQLARLAEKPLPLDVVSRIAIDVLEGLHAAHEAVNDTGVPLQVVHRDVSPQNVLIEEGGYARLVDFGIAKALERSYVTRSGEVRGKLSYMAPEQFASGPMDRRVDIWGFGMVLWELLAGARPFADLDAGVVVARILSGSIARPSRPDAEPLVDICMRALSLEPSARWATAREMALAVERAHPPATPRDVATCLKRFASSQLRERRATLTEMAELAARRRRWGGASPTADPVSEPRMHAVDKVPVGTESVSVEILVPGARNPRSRRSLTALLVALVVVGGVAVGGVAFVRSRAKATTGAPAATAAAPETFAEPPPSASGSGSASTATPSNHASASNGTVAAPAVEPAPNALASASAPAKRTPATRPPAVVPRSSAARPTTSSTRPPPTPDPLAHDQRD